jgi:signal transduction histidine kinase
LDNDFNAIEKLINEIDLISKEITENTTIESLLDISQNTPERSHKFEDVKLLNVSFSNLIQSLIERESKIEQLKKQQMEEEKIKFLGEISRKVSHDLRSPLLVLNNYLESMSYIYEVDHKFIESCLSRINNIANEVLLQSSVKTIEENEQLIDVESFFQKIITEKCIEHNNSQFKFNNKLKNKQSLRVRPLELERVFSNLLNNSLEANLNNRSIVLTLDLSSEHTLKVEVADQGFGMTPEVMAKFGKVSYSSKNILESKSGSGIGVLNAYQFIESISGSISVFSELNKGTCLTICLPLVVERFYDYVCVDDDSLVHLNWKLKSKNANKRVLLLSDAREMDTYINKFDKNRTNFYIDKNLIELDGITLALSLKSRGFQHVYMASAENIDTDLGLVNVGKNCPL